MGSGGELAALDHRQDQERSRYADREDRRQAVDIRMRQEAGEAKSVDIPQAPVYGGTNLTASNINVGNTNMSYIALGSPDAGNSSAYVDIAEVIFMNGTLGGAGSATQVDIYNYFKAKYPTLGLP